jgi:GxxExxY protein
MSNRRVAEPSEDSENTLTGAVIGAAIKVHRALGPGLLEGIYAQCLQIELETAGIKVETEVAVPVRYGGHLLRTRFRLDLLVEERLIVELKAVPEILPLHKAQVLTYLKLTGRPLGLLINFNVEALVRGVRRVIYHPSESSAPSAALWLP